MPLPLPSLTGGDSVRERLTSYEYYPVDTFQVVLTKPPAQIFFPTVDMLLEGGFSSSQVSLIAANPELNPVHNNVDPVQGLCHPFCAAKN